MGHLIFLALHLVALLTGVVLLVVTIPAHLIYIAIKSKNADEVAEVSDHASP